MDLEITQPFRLAALVVLPLLVFYWWRGLPGFGWWQRTTSLVIRVLLVVLLVPQITVEGTPRDWFA